MMMKEGHVSESDLPRSIGKPATRALTNAGWIRLEQLAARSEAELLILHGVGPKAIRILRQALEEKGLSFSDNSQ
jgi:predicted Fe-Mo cluster-binding NifX family protein